MIGPLLWNCGYRFLSTVLVAIKNLKICNKMLLVTFWWIITLDLAHIIRLRHQTLGSHDNLDEIYMALWAYYTPQVVSLPDGASLIFSHADKNGVNGVLIIRGWVPEHPADIISSNSQFIHISKSCLQTYWSTNSSSQLIKIVRLSMKF